VSRTTLPDVLLAIVVGVALGACLVVFVTPT
jgi:hypothetical protein